DLWVIHARFLKKGVSVSNSTTTRPTLGGSTAPSSQASLETQSSHKASDPQSSQSRAAEHSTASGASSAQQENKDVINGVWVFIDIQLYTLDANNYVVDFKCDGYQNVIYAPSPSRSHSSEEHPETLSSAGETAAQTDDGDDLHQQSSSSSGHPRQGPTEEELNGQAGWKPVSKRVRNKEKEVSSPYPYLDVVSDLVAQLAVTT
ncbi:Protein kinase, partial [Ascosphaera atra]